MEEVDKTNKSYYGSSFLYCIPQRKDTFKVELDKQGPIYSYEWAPDSSHFCVCYGFMPSKACVYDMKGNVVWDLGEGHRNEVHFNRFGNILALCAFGNISSGKIQLWDVASKKEIASWDVNCTVRCCMVVSFIRLINTLFRRTSPGLRMDSTSTRRRPPPDCGSTTATDCSTILAR